MDDREYIKELEKRCDSAVKAIGQCRETNARLNRRCQTYERALHEKIEKGRDEYRNLGRALANGAATAYWQKLEDIEALCRDTQYDRPAGNLAAEIMRIIERNMPDDIERALSKGDSQ